MALHTVASITARVVVVILLVSAASAPAVAAFDGKATATFDHQSLADDPFDERANDDVLRLSYKSAERITPPIVGERSFGASERLERAAHWGVQSLYEADKILPYLGFVLGYSRYDGSDPLENARRADVYETITDSPGIYVSKVSDETHIHRSTVRYHVRVLEEEGLIAEKILHGKHRLYPVETTDVSLVAALDDEATATILRALLRSEPASVSLLADDLDRAPSTVSHHLTRLAEDGLITQERNGNTVLTRLSQNVREALQSTETASIPERGPANVRADS